MKRIISLTLAVLMLAALLLTATSCGMESISGYTLLRDHIIDQVGYDKDMALNEYVTIRVATLDGGDTEVHATIGGYNPNPMMSGTPVRITLKMNGSVEKANLVCEVLDTTTHTAIAWGYAEVLLTHYTGNETISFTSQENISFVIEDATEDFATVLLNSLLLAIDTYTTNSLGLDLRDMGFIALADKYMADTEIVEAEEELGGAFSSARLSLAGLMILEGVGMVFLVLAILWLVLLIFKAIFYKDPAKADKTAEKPAPAKAEAPVKKSAPAPAPAATPAPAADDAQLIAVITAAVAAAIESDSALTSQFASGFRVVSFKKTEKTTRNR